MNSERNKTVTINLSGGNLASGFPSVIARLWDEHNLQAEQFVGSLPANTELRQVYRLWQSTYRSLCRRVILRSSPSVDTEGGLEIEEGSITQVSQLSFQQLSQQLEQQINGWLQSESFLTIERSLRSRLTPDAEVRVIFEVDDDLLCRLPWHCWTFFRDYPNAEIGLSQPEYRRRVGTLPKARKPVRILAVLGDRRGIDVEAERAFLQSLPDAEIYFLVAPSRQELNHQLWDAIGWDILFFAGHSQTEGETGRLYINEQPVHNSLTIEQLEEALNTAIDLGLKLAIFNSCDGVGLAQALERLNIPQVLVMREPVPNQVAQAFLKYFLEAFATERLPLYLAVRQARRKLQGLEDLFPGASWLPVLCQNPAIASPTWLQLGGMPPCPYRGLFAFQETDARLFFGREQFTEVLINAVKQRRLVAVVGPSGSGKSSVVLAGLLPRLRSQTHASRSWQMVAFRPGINPFDALAEALMKLPSRVVPDARHPEPDDSQAFRLKTLELAVELQHDRHTLSQRIEQFNQQRPTCRLVLIADQFEELYTLCPEDHRQTFLDSLLQAVECAPAFTLVLTLRADFYGYALLDRRFSDRLQGSVYNLGPMSREELCDAIVQPAAQMQVKLEAGLADQLIQATWGHAGRLPLLEFALTQLWSQQQGGWLTHQAYTEIGGVEEAIANHAEEVYAQLEAIDQQRAQQIFVQLVEPGAGIEPIRRLATRDEVGETNWDLVTRLASSRLVVTNRNEVTEEETVEIVHEALLRNWGRLEQWLQVDDEFRRWQEGLRLVRRQWEHSGQDEEALLRGKLLTDAKYWSTNREDELSSRDRDFIRLSVSVQERDNRRRKRRRQTIISSLVTGLMAALMLAGMAWWGWQRASLSEVQAIRISSDALFTLEKPFDALMEALRAEQKLKTLVWSEAETRTGVELALRQAVSRVVEQNRLVGHDGGVTAVVFSPDGKLIASASQDHTVRLWNRDGSLSRILKGHDNEVWGVAISPDGKLIASASNDKTAKLWNRSGALITTFKGHSDEVNAVAFSPDGQIIATASNDNTVQLWHPDGSRIRTLKRHSAKVNAVAFSPDGQTIASASADNTIQLWKLDGTPIKTLKEHTDAVRDVAFSPDGRWLVSASVDQTIKLWRSDGSFLSTFKGHGNIVYKVEFSRDSQQIVSASNDKTVKLWNLDGTILRTLAGHSDGVMGVTFSPDHETIASASLDRTVKLWTLKNPLQTTLGGHRDIVWDVAFSPDNQTIASASGDHTVKLWTRDGAFLKTLKKHSDIVYGIAFSPDSQTIASASRDGTLNLWTRDGVFLTTLKHHHSWVTGVAFSPDNQLIASASVDHTLSLWTRNGAFLTTLEGHTGTVWGVAFSPDSQRIASASNDKTIRLWQRDGTFLKTLRGHQEGVNAVTFSPDSQLIASASNDKTIRLWKPDGTFLKALNGHTEGVNNVAFQRDSQLLASTSVDKTIKLWNKDGTLLLTLNGYREGIVGAEFSPDGQTLAATSVDGTMTLWNMQRVLDVKALPTYGCNWLRDYLKTNSSISQSDRQFCLDTLQ